MILEKRWHWFCLLVVCVFITRTANAQWYGSLGQATLPDGGSEVNGETYTSFVASGSSATLSMTMWGSARQANFAWNGTAYVYTGGTAEVGFSLSGSGVVTVNRSGFVFTYPGTLSLEPPEEEEEEIIGAIDLDGFDEIKYEVWVDTDSDGDPDTVIQNGVISDGQTFNYQPGDEAWEIVAVEGKMNDGTKVPLNQNVASGIGTSPPPVPTPTPSVSYTPGPSIDYVTVDEGGNVTSTPISTGNTTVNGQPSTTYTYNNANGGATTVIYSGTSATDGAKTQDIRLASAQNSAENERILTSLDKLSDQIAAANSGTASAPTVTVGADPTENYQTAPGENPNEEAGEEVRVKGQNIFDELGNITGSIKNGAGRAVMPTIGASYGSTLSWTVSLPVLGAMSVDLSPWSGVIGAFRSFLKFVLALIAWLVCIKILRGTFV